MSHVLSKLLNMINYIVFMCCVNILFSIAEEKIYVIDNHIFNAVLSMWIYFVHL